MVLQTFDSILMARQSPIDQITIPNVISFVKDPFFEVYLLCLMKLDETSNKNKTVNESNRPCALTDY